MPVPERKHPLARCEVCPLRDSGTFVPSEIPSNPRLIVVGEAPGGYEAKKGRPFVGPSGQLLDQVLAHHGYQRSEVMLTNVCLCRPKDNATPPKSAIAACRPRLLDELRCSSAPDMVALGGTAADALVDDTRTITKLRVGPPKRPTRDLADSTIQRVVPTWHPAYCVNPRTRILTADLRWLEAQNLEPGMTLVGFDEHPGATAYSRRQFKPTVVEGIVKRKAHCFKVTTNRGPLIVSGSHMWLVKKRASYYTKLEWRRTDQLTEAYDLQYFIEPWETVEGRDGGYAAGILDGEGWLSLPNGVGWAQNDGAVADEMLRILKDHNLQVSKRYEGNCAKYHFEGKRRSMRVLGMFRPHRLLPKAEELWRDIQCSSVNVPVLCIEDVGEQDVITINTSTRTFIAEGFMSHNCLRSADNFPALVSDIGKLKDVKRGAWRPPDWKYFDDPASALQVLSELGARATHLVVDIEVGIEKDTDFGHPNEYELLAVGLGYARGKAVVLGEVALRDREVLDGLKLLLEQVKIIAHNGKFDLGGLYPHIGGQTLWFDTMLASYCLDERPGNHGLKTLAVERLGAPQYDLEILEYVPRGGNYSNIPRPLLYKYNAYDVTCTWELFEMFQEMLEHSDQRRLHDFMVAASNELMYLELNGITIDRMYMNTLRGEFIRRLEELEDQLSELVCKPISIGDPLLDEIVNDPNLPVVFNPRSPKQVKEHLARLDINVDSTNKDTLETLLKFQIITKGRETDDPIVRFIQTLLVHRRQQKLFSTYVEGIRKRLYRGRVYTTYMLHGTTSGRLASRNPNLQNVVRDNAIRRQFSVSKPENILIQADMKQAEGRVMCALAQDEYLRRVFSDPTVDIFDELTNQLYGEGAWDKAQRKEQRIRTKAFFYGIGYGREPYSIALEYEMSVREAERRYAEFLDLIPGVVAWQEDVKRRIHAGEDLVTSFGRRRRFWLITEQNQKDVENEALSFMPQSISSDITLDAFTRLRPMLRGLGFIRLTIHDALTVETAEERKEQVATILMDEMEAAGRRWTDYVPFRTDVSFGKNWGEL